MSRRWKSVKRTAEIKAGRHTYSGLRVARMGRRASLLLLLLPLLLLLEEEATTIDAFPHHISASDTYNARGFQSSAFVMERLELSLSLSLSTAHTHRHEYAVAYQR